MISVIIPTWNSAALLPRALAPLVAGVAEGLVKQVVVADAGSTDETLTIADAAGCDTVTSERGRAKQMMAGVAKARAPWLLFLHPEAELAPGWIAEARTFARRGPLRAAAFSFALDDDTLAARGYEWIVRQRVRFLKQPLGVQGLLISRAFYDALGGYHAGAAMEDFDLARRIRRHRLTLLESRALIDAEAFRREGYLKRAARETWALVFGGRA